MKTLLVLFIGSIGLLAYAAMEINTLPCSTGKKHRTQEIVTTQQGTARVTIDYCN